MYRHHLQTHLLESAIANGSIGRLRHLRAAFCFTLDDPDDVRLRPELDGGSLMDLGCYCVNGVRLLAGEPDLVFGRSSGDGVDMRFSALLQFADGVVAQFHCAFDLPYESRLEALGATGSALVREPWLCRDPHVELTREGSVERIDVEDADRYQLELENFAAAARGEAKPLLGRDDAVAQARVIAALYRSAATGEAVAL
jgi:D-xylose 1-dehydrogenase (NADP+, D-xylono-1,5-lactone-forming)